MRLPALLILAASLTPLAALAQTAPEGAAIDSDRYTMHETAEGWLRLDRTSGKVSLCKAKEGRWTCAPVPDAVAAYEAEARALEEDKRRLRKRVAELETRIGEIEEAIRTPPPGAVTPPQRKEPALTPQEEREIDRFMDFSERALKRFFGMVKTLKREFEEET